MKRQNKRKTGAEYEQFAARYMSEAGCEVLMQNYRCRVGEIDLIVRDGAYLVFCEVKYRTDTGAGHPLEAVDVRKQRTIARCALFYMTEHQMDDIPCRFDVIAVCGERVTWIKNAFEAE